jgi:1-deoxy-D-xylulose-5-phosphate reductoisomerase
MRVPIGYALRHPEPPPVRPAVDLTGRTLEFGVPDEVAFPALALARAAGREAGTAPAILNAANEIAVEAFLDRRLPFLGIAQTVEDVLGEVASEPACDLATVMGADAAARSAARARLGSTEAVR